MVVSRKHQNAIVVDNKSPFFIATNKLPDFGDDTENVMRRLKIFKTKSLPKWMQKQGVIEHYKAHSMHYIAWMAEQINCNLELIENAERKC